ncbi:SPOR domain-containing protein [Treponema primitia]|uniref:SPOR domain-containing protein n=1 Tax=Treponema primitia TaxID=88058 RepID=UPI000255535C|nr:SPOR domain-containing protein [Treponema primitia]
MISINSRFLVLPVLFLFLCGAVSGQSAGTGPSPLAAEIRSIEGKLRSPISASERREAYIKLAQLQRLSGNVDTAAQAWREAALADPANRDDRCFLESALCYLALGEFDAASDALRGILSGGGDTTAARDAQYLTAQIEVFRHGGTDGSTASLYALLEKPEFQDYRPAIYYTFWRLFGDAAYKAQILSEFPGSPEARILESEAAIAADNTVTNAPVSVHNRPLWFFFPGRGNVAIGAAVPTQPAAYPPVQYQPPAPALSAAAPSTAVAPESTGGPRALQAGLFSREENAQAMVSRLASRGFTASVSQKLVNGVTYWAVTLPPGENSNQTILRLKDAGFESFPVF